MVRKTFSPARAWRPAVVARLARTLARMSGILSIPDLLEAWRLWAVAQRSGADIRDLTGWMEFNWAVEVDPEHAWSAILAALEDPRMQESLGVLAAGPLEDLLSIHGERFIGRVESTARANPKFAWLLGGVWQHTMPEDVWSRVQAVWNRTGWDGVPANAG